MDSLQIKGDRSADLKPLAVSYLQQNKKQIISSRLISSLIAIKGDKSADLEPLAVSYYLIILK